MEVTNEKILAFENNIKNAITVEEKVRAYLLYRNFLMYYDPIKSEKVINEAIEYAKNFATEEDLYKFYFCKINFHIQLNQIHEAFELLNFCMEHHRSTNNLFQLSLLYSSIANIFFYMHMYYMAIYVIYYSIQNFIPPSDKKALYSAYNNLMNIYFESLKIEKFDELFIKHLIQYFEQNIEQNTVNFITANINLARFYRLKKNFEKSISQYIFVIQLCEKNQFNQVLPEIHYDLGLLYKDKSNENKMIFHYLESLELTQKHNIPYINVDLYDEIYLYYKNNKDEKKCLEFLELKIENENKLREEIKERTKIMESLGFYNNLQNEVPYIKNFIENLNFENQNLLIIENIKGEMIKVNIEEIVYVTKLDEFLQILFVDGKVIHIKSHFKEFVAKLKEMTNEIGLFFETNSRNQLVNLFWLSNMDYIKREITLNVFQKEYSFLVSKRQIAPLKKIIYDY